MTDGKGRAEEDEWTKKKRGKRPDGAANEQTRERASARASESSERFPREKRYPRFSPSSVVARDPQLPRRRDRRDRQLSELQGTAQKTTQRARDVIVQAARSVPLRHFDPLRSFSFPFPRSLVASRIEAARRDPRGRVSKSHLARESLPSLFPGDSFSRLALSLPSRPAPPHLFIFSLDRCKESVFWSPSNLRGNAWKKTYSWILLQVLLPLYALVRFPLQRRRLRDFSLSWTQVPFTHE